MANPCMMTWIQTMQVNMLFRIDSIRKCGSSMNCSRCNYFLVFIFHCFIVIGVIEAKRPSFYAGSRYGRSQYYEPETSNNLHVAPRRDYHFLRYGKRSEESTIKCYENVRGFVLTCSFTGVQDFYRCWKG